MDLAVSFVEREVVPGDAKNWEAILEKTSLSYSGQEVTTAQHFTVAQLETALPPKGVAGSIQIPDVCEEGVRAALLDASLARLPCAKVEGPLPRARLHVAPGELTTLSRLLVNRDLAVPVGDEEIWQHEGKPALAGLFGVEKKGEQVSSSDTRCRLRLIINLVPANTLRRVIPGDIVQVPTAGQRSCIHLMQHEIMLLSSSDRKCFFLCVQASTCMAGSHGS